MNEQEAVADCNSYLIGDEVEDADSEELLMIRRVLSSRFEPEVIEQQENIFSFYV